MISCLNLSSVLNTTAIDSYEGWEICIVPSFRAQQLWLASCLWQWISKVPNFLLRKKYVKYLTNQPCTIVPLPDHLNSHVFQIIIFSKYVCALASVFILMHNSVKCARRHMYVNCFAHIWVATSHTSISLNCAVVAYLIWWTQSH